LHSLHFLSIAVTEPSPGIPQFMVLGYVDGIPISRYDSERGRVEPLTPWMAAGGSPWIQSHPPGLHTRQRLYGCDLLSDGSVRGYNQIGYDGRDFISFELGSRRFVAADGAAQITKRKWEHDGIEVDYWRNYLENTCLEWLQKFVRYGREALERKGF
ncbi:major histocompatibility complex class I-related gene protein-like, partial [Manacus vitellinus]|uniref:major histocompatibility complex class I-related gene protein-like n=1 Tax=Manacus vitellinus TaxID=328815 RepID=UPI00115E6E07